MESRRFWKWMLTALPTRFYFEALCLAGFRVPQESRSVKAPDLIESSLIMVVKDFLERRISFKYLMPTKISIQ